MTQNQHPSHDAEIRRLNRISGQVEGVKKMIEEHRYCPDILSQLRAIRSAVKGVETEILRRHLSLCVTSAMQNGDEASRERSIDEVARLFSKFEE
jgi:CsoR family transcriptional regulator, copper-sensing transcriptional repressor